MERAEVDRWLGYHSRISYALTTERTALESALIPVSAYILVACVEAYRRYPDMIRAITAAAYNPATSPDHDLPSIPGKAASCVPPPRPSGAGSRSSSCWW